MKKKKKELGVDASDAVENVHHNMMLYISGNLSAFEANKNITECIKRIRENRGHLETMSENVYTIVSKKEFICHLV